MSQECTFSKDNIFLDTLLLFRNLNEAEGKIMVEFNGKKYRCEIDFSVHVVRGKWAVDIICYLNYHKVLRFNELKRLLPKITHKILAQQLHELECFKIVEKKIYPEIPPKVEYTLTKSGEELYVILEKMIQWANNHIAQTCETINDRNGETSNKSI